LADLSRGDVFLFKPGDNHGTAIVIGIAAPGTVPSVKSGLAVGDRVSMADEPTVLKALLRGAPARRRQRIRSRRQITLQDAYPIRRGARVAGVLAIEVDLVECDRLERKSVIYRRTLDRLRRLVVAGQLRGAAGLTRLNEHDGPMVVTSAGEIVYASAVAEQLYRKAGYTQGLWQQNLANLRTDESVFFKAVDSNSCVEQVIEEGPLTWQKRAIPIFGSGGDRFWSRVLNRIEKHDPLILTVNDVTEESRKERELRIKSAMIQEIHHRVKNNLQTIASLLRLQARRTGSEEVGAMLQETINRILSIAVVHEFLARQESGDVDTREIAQQIIGEVSRSILDPEKHVRFSLDATTVCLPTQQATSVALVINELLHNAVEHAFATKNEGNVTVAIRTTDDQVVLTVADDGEGLPETFSLRTDGSLGLQIVQTLVKDDLKGTFHLVRAGERGARGIVSFPRIGSRLGEALNHHVATPVADGQTHR